MRCATRRMVERFMSLRNDGMITLLCLFGIRGAAFPPNTWRASSTSSCKCLALSQAGPVWALRFQNISLRHTAGRSASSLSWVAGPLSLSHCQQQIEKKQQAQSVRGKKRPMSKRILIIDDEEHVRRVTALALEAAGYGVGEAADGSAGLQAFGDGSGWDCVILDQRMP